MAKTFTRQVSRPAVTAAKLALTTVVLFAGVVVPAVPAQLGASASIDQTLDQLSKVHEFTDVAVSPDGKQVAWVENWREPAGSSSNYAIYVKDLAGGAAQPHRITAASNGVLREEHDIAWSADSKQLVFLSDADTPNQLQVYVASAADGRARRLTQLAGMLSRPRFSPDGHSVALLFTENVTHMAGPLMPVSAPSGVIGSVVREQRLAVVDAASGQIRQLSPAGMFVYEYDWSPDSKQLAIIAAHGDGDANWYLAQLYLLNAASPRMQPLYKPPLQIGNPTWSPDGRQIAFIAGLMSDEGRTGGDIYVVPAAGGPARNVTPGMKATANWVTWLPDNKTILFFEDLPGKNGVAQVILTTGQINCLWSGPQQLTDTPAPGTRIIAFNVSRDGHTAALVPEYYGQPPEVWAGPVGDWKQLTHANAGVTYGFGKSESIHWRNEGYQLQGWLIHPRDYHPGGRYPMIVQIHGGPSSVVRIRWFYDLSILSLAGYFVFLPNARGSFGQGEGFTRANVRDFGYGDLRDILSGIDYVVKHYPVDENRMGVAGWSYGGFMTMWAVTQTHRFRAAVAGAGIANWQSYYGENDIDQMMPAFFGASFYDDPAIYARSSPINFIKNVKTPTLILVGEHDGECPAPQSFEFWHALKDLGIENQFVVYAGEGHRMTAPQDRRDVIERTMAWFDHYLRTNPHP